MSMQVRLSELLSPWLDPLPVHAGLDEVVDRLAPAAMTWEAVSGRPVDHAWFDAQLHELCAAKNADGSTLAWVLAYAGLAKERLDQATDFTADEVEKLLKKATAAVCAKAPKGAFARARQVGIDRGRRPVPRQARGRSL